MELIAPTKDRVTEAGAGRDAEAQAAPAAKGSKGEAILQNKVTNNLVFHLHLEPSEKREIHFLRSKKSRALGSFSSAEYCGTIITFW